MKADPRTKKALARGRSHAESALAKRKQARRRRAKALRAAAQEPGQPVIAALPILAPFSAATRGVLVAEGDSWFDYPWTDVLEVLEDDYGFDVESVAHKGDRVEDMAYSEGQLGKFVRTLERVLRTGIPPRAILLSGGGNDIAGAEFAMLLDHALSPVPGLNASVMSGVIDERLRYSYVTILSSVTKVCVELAGAPVPILIHGYDYPVPDGRGFLGGFGPLPGPWLEPGLRQKAYPDVKVQRMALVTKLIDRFNAMLGKVAALGEFKHVRHLDLRGTLSTGAQYKDWWANELHPTPRGFRKLAKKFADGIG